MEMLKEESRPIIILLGVFLLLRLPLLLYTPLIQDEAVYAMMIEEQRDGLTLVPTFFGYPVSWKPMLFFWLHAVLPHMPGPMELTFRIPTFLFAMATLVPLYLFLRNAGLSRAVAFISLLIFQVTYITSYPSVVGLIDSMLFFLITLSLFTYSEERLGRWRFLAAGALAFAAYFTKLAVAAMIPVLAMAYFLFIGKRKTLHDPLFIISLLAVPVAAVLGYLIFQSAGLAEESYGTYMLDRLVTGQAVGQVWSGFYILLLTAGAWFSLSIVGFVRHWKENLLMTAWYLLGIFPLVGTFFLPWYFLPVMPAIGYFSTLALVREGDKEKLDGFFTAFFAFLLLLTAGASMFVHELDRMAFEPQKEAGLFLSGKENVGFIGKWATVAISYKVLDEIWKEGKAHDFGWVLFPEVAGPSLYYDFMEDYYTDKYPVNQGSFSSAYALSEIFRKDTEIEEFDYYVISGLDNFTMEGAEPMYNDSGIFIYKVGG